MRAGWNADSKTLVGRSEKSSLGSPFPCLKIRTGTVVFADGSYVICGPNFLRARRRDVFASKLAQMRAWASSGMKDIRLFGAKLSSAQTEVLNRYARVEQIDLFAYLEEMEAVIRPSPPPEIVVE